MKRLTRARIINVYLKTIGKHWDDITAHERTALSSFSDELIRQVRVSDLATTSPKASPDTANPPEAPPPPDTLELDHILGWCTGIHTCWFTENITGKNLEEEEEIRLQKAQLLDWKQRSELEARIDEAEFIKKLHDAEVSLGAALTIYLAELKDRKATLQKKLRGEAS